ncbi:hypothetical protein [Micromonospora sp. WMMD710]|uniref:hypothetical protein n=1 Tax=Micromonospora sp. WMMD710 TaxID=3016085 RepID=UPI0024166096|nr:hypothetical protein [Micromonospora sp. WMMD710]MDG4762093.1 hypothetical protein [Micromonospora sp. WMMD710]
MRLDDQLRHADVALLGGLDLERHHDARPRAGAPDQPEQLRLVLRVGADQRAVGEHHLDRPDPVDGEAVGAYQPADAAAGGQTAHAHAAVVARTDHQAVRGQRLRDVRPPGAGLDPDQPGPLVEHLHPVEHGQVDDHATVVGGGSGEAVPPAADRDGQPLLPRVADRVDHLRRGLRQQDGGRRRRRGVRRAQLRVPAVAGRDDLPGE